VSSLEPEARVKVLLTCLVALLCVAVPASAGTSTARTLEACIFVTSGDDETGPTENVKILDAAQPRRKGTFTLEHAGKVIGIALSSFPVTGAGVFTLAVRLTTRPAQAHTIRFTIRTGNMALQQSGCRPH
jgi:hypothetical protein